MQALLQSCPRARSVLTRILFTGWSLLALGIAGMQGAAAAEEAMPAGFPTIELQERTRGEAAIQALDRGRHLPALARFYNVSPEELTARLRRDKSLWVDQKGRLLYVCELHDHGSGEDSHAEAESADTPTIAAAPYPDEETFRLHSRPGALRVIYLDFDGVNASGTSWGAAAIGRAFDTDGNPSAFSSSERAIIQGVWQRVAEDFAMYDVDVTTEDPGLEALRKSNTSDTTYGIRVAIAGSSMDWYGKGAGGVAYVGSFNWNSDTPCWVFPGSLSNSEKNIAEATSHEIGHTLGLSHDGKLTGTTLTEYYSGQGNWAPIMGTGYSKPITQWSRGEYTDANNKEDDLAKMLTYGVAYRADDHGSSLGGATPLSGVSFNLPGNIERSTDVDYFRFQCGAGQVSIVVQPAPKGPNLRILLNLLNASGGVIATANPADTTAGVQPASISTTLAAGVYYISVQGTGSGDPLTTGYSSYASIGEYTLSGSLPSSSSWVATAPGSAYLWTTPANWSGNSYPFGAGATARLINNIAGDQVISISGQQILGRLEIGDADSLHTFKLQNGPLGSVVFDAPSGLATLVKTTGATDQIVASLTLNCALEVFNSSASDLVLGGDISGPGGLLKTGGGNLVLAGTNSASGNLVVSAGTLLLGEFASIASPVIDVRAGADINAQAAAGLVLNGGQTLLGEGTVAGGLLVGNGATLAPGSNYLTGTLTVAGGIILEAGARLHVDIGSSTTVGSGSNDLLVVNGDLHLAGPVAVSVAFPAGLPPTPATYTLATYTGALIGSAANLQPVAAGDRFTYAFDDSIPGEIRVHITGAPAGLVWKGDGVINVWDLGTSTNWMAAGDPAVFRNLDDVSFEDSGLNLPSLWLNGSLEAGSVIVASSRDYTFAGNGKITGKTGLTKSGTGALTILSANDFDGDVVVSGGSLRTGNSAAMGSARGSTIILDGATFDLNAQSLGDEPLKISGAGVDDNGALVNSSAAARTNALRFLALTGNTIIGGVGRWDLRATPTATLAGNNFDLVKTGGNEIWFSDAGPSGLGNIVINQGTLGFEGSTTLGLSTRAITVRTNATLALSRNSDNALYKSLILDGGRVNCITGFNVWNGVISLANSNTLIVNSSLAMRSTISGTGSLTKTGGGTLMLNAANSYIGETRILGGTVETYHAMALGSSTAGTIIGSGARLDVRGNNLGAEPITVTGTGLGNAGAIVNTGSSQNNALRFVTLSGATTFGGIGRWDIRANPTGSLTGNNYALTKRGPNEVWLVDLGSTGLAGITVAEGLLGVQGTTTLGSPSSTLTVSANASFGIYATGTNVLAKTLSLSGGRIYNANGANSLSGTVSLSGSNRLDVASGSRLTLSGTISGSGDIHKLSTGTLVIAGNNSGSGLIRVAAGTLQFGDGGAFGMPGSGLITNSGAIVFNRNNALNVNNTITGTGTLQIGVTDNTNPWVGSTIILNGTNTYSGNTLVYGNGNVVAVGHDRALGTGTLMLNGNSNGDSVSGIRSANASLRTITNSVQLGAGGRFQLGSPGTGDLVFSAPRLATDGSDKTLLVSNVVTTISSAIGGDSRLIKSGPGTLVLTGLNTNGAMTISMGVLRVDSEFRLGRNPASFNLEQLAFDGGTLQTTATFAIDDSNRGIALRPAGGTFQVNSSSTLTVVRPITGAGGLTKTGPGTLQLSTLNNYTGGTTNLEGTLTVNGEIGQGPVEILAGTLSGFGKVLGPVAIRPGAILSPGMGIGTLTVSNTLDLAGLLVMEVNATLGSSDKIQGMTAAKFGGTLVVQNLQGTFAGGERLKLFDAASYEGAFNNVVLPALGPGLVWDTSALSIDGSVSVAAVMPEFTTPQLQDGALVLSGNGGAPGAEFVLRYSTNATLPLIQWPIASTNVFDASGAFRLTNEVDVSVPQLFYRVQVSGW
jgi:autotransporter-associated beta strand protein